MRIRSAVVTASGAAIAMAAVLTVVLATTPQEASPGLIRFLWAAIFLFIWALVSTLLLIARQSMAQSIWVGLLPAISATALLATQQRGALSQRLLMGVLLATLGLSAYIWWRLRHRHPHD